MEVKELKNEIFFTLAVLKYIHLTYNLSCSFLYCYIEIILLKFLSSIDGYRYS